MKRILCETARDFVDSAFVGLASGSCFNDGSRVCWPPFVCSRKTPGSPAVKPLGLPAVLLSSRWENAIFCVLSTGSSAEKR